MAQTDRAALGALYNATGGPNWKHNTHWNTDADLSKWHGITTNDQGRVVRLSLDSNNLKGAIPPQLGNLAALKELNLADNQLSGPIPMELGTLSELKQLFLNHNKLTGRIPEELGALSNLHWLSFYDNQLTGTIPEELGKLIALRRLGLGSNNLSGAIPKELGALTKLKSLDLSHNQLSVLWDEEGASQRTPPSPGVEAGPLPSELGAGLRMLEKADASLQGNPWQYPPLGVVSGGLAEVRKYFTAVFAEGSRVVERPLKVVLIGKEKVGKTSLRQSLRESKACRTDDIPEARTVHIDVEDIKIHDKDVRVFDCAGQEAYYASLQLFLTPNALYLLVVDMASAVENVAENAQNPLGELGVLRWVRSLTYRVPKAAVVLVGTKCDLVTDLPPLSSLNRLEAAAATVQAKISCCISSWAKQNSSPQIRLEDGMRLVRFDESTGSPQVDSDKGWPCDVNGPGLLGRTLRDSSGNKRAVSMKLPLSWHHALDFLDECARRRSAREGFQGVPKTALQEKWRKESKTRSANGTNWDAAKTALEGALLLRGFEGGLVVYGSYVFFDVHWLADVLKPLLSDRLVTSYGCTTLGGKVVPSSASSASLKRFEQKGILEPTLADVLWGEETAPHVLKTLESAGLTFPRAGDECHGVVILLRLPTERPEPVGVKIDDFRLEKTKEGRNGQIKVVCTFPGGVPPGFIERLLTKCCHLGACDPFWRFGVLIESGELFSAILEYRESDEIHGRLTLDVFGDCTTAGPWGGMSACLSVVIQLLSEFPGMTAAAGMECQQHFSDNRIEIELSQPREWVPLIRNVDGCASCSERHKEVARLLLLYVPVTDSPLDIEEILPKFNQAARSEQVILSRWAQRNEARWKSVAEADAAAAQREAEHKATAEEAELKRKQDADARASTEAAKRAKQKQVVQVSVLAYGRGLKPLTLLPRYLPVRHSRDFAVSVTFISSSDGCCSSESMPKISENLPSPTQRNLKITKEHGESFRQQT
ncbi:unnamed protein product [Ectocarpus fasciculatus]